MSDFRAWREDDPARGDKVHAVLVAAKAWREALWHGTRDEKRSTATRLEQACRALWPEPPAGKG